MNQNNTKIQTSRLPEIIAIILVLAAIGYYFFSSGSSSSGSSSFTVSTQTSSVGSSVLNLLNQIHSLQIDTSLFSEPAYQSLTDFSVTVPPETIGKANPFLAGSPAANSISASASSSQSSGTAAAAVNSASTGQSQ